MLKRHSHWHTSFPFVCLALVFGLRLTAQAQLRIAPIQPDQIGESITCRVGGSTEVLQPDKRLIRRLSFAPDNVETQKLFDEVARHTELRINIYTVPVTNNINVQICPGDDSGRNYIAYSPSWLEKIYQETRNRWALYAIIAHEIGHYARNHDRTSSGSNPEIELEADEYAGEILAKMGVPLPDAEAAFKTKIIDVKGKTHPPRDERLARVRKGWERGRGTRPPSATETARRSPARKVTIGRSGYIDGLNGRLNPILDSDRRTYIYADNIAIDGGKNQPVNFSPNQPFLAEDSLGNQFELRVRPESTDSFTIEYEQVSSAADKEREDLNVKVLGPDSRPVRGAEVVAIFADGTYLKGASDVRGNALIEKLKQRVVTIYCAHENYAAFYQEGHDAGSELVIDLKAEPGKGSVIISSAGYVPGLSGRLNPILDSINRTYLYADDISVENGRKQPVTFRLNEPLQVEDKERRRFELKIVAIKARTSLIEFTRLN
jgi:hypothetical protein